MSQSLVIIICVILCAIFLFLEFGLWLILEIKSSKNRNDDELEVVDDVEQKEVLTKLMEDNDNGKKSV